MNNKFKPFAAVSTGAVALVLLVAMSAPRIRQEPTPAPSIRPVSAFAQEDRVIPPAEPQSALVDEKVDNVEPDNAPLTEIDFASPKPNNSPTITTPKDAPMDNPTPTPAQSQNTESFTATEPKMGDTRTVDGQNQVYFLGFGWIADNDMPNECIVVDGEGDINKMVGRMD